MSSAAAGPAALIDAAAAGEGALTQQNQPGMSEFDSLAEMQCADPRRPRGCGYPGQ
ncbi:hypothetical protein [Corynebacterium sp. A21]|uniref:hypothetical protein n=1 Tax=Corynebacterium sp. A21 TaxID=3457318 RepID=UPI003FD62C0D